MATHEQSIEEDMWNWVARREEDNQSVNVGERDFTSELRKVVRVLNAEDRGRDRHTDRYTHTHKNKDWVGGCGEESTYLPSSTRRQAKAAALIIVHGKVGFLHFSIYSFSLHFWVSGFSANSPPRPLVTNSGTHGPNPNSRDLPRELCFFRVGWMGLESNKSAWGWPKIIVIILGEC